MKQISLLLLTFILIGAGCGLSKSTVPLVTVPTSNKGFFYSSPEYGFSATFPTEFEVHDKIIKFGPVGDIPEGPIGAKSRGYTLSVVDVRSSQDILKMIKNEKEPPLTELNKVTKINGLDVVEYTGSGMCSYPTIEVIGKKFNYTLQPVCGTSNDFEYMTRLVETMGLK